MAEYLTLFNLIPSSNVIRGETTQLYAFAFYLQLLLCRPCMKPTDLQNEVVFSLLDPSKPDDFQVTVRPHSGDGMHSRSALTRHLVQPHFSTQMICSSRLSLSEMSDRSDPYKSSVNSDTYPLWDRTSNKEDMAL